MTEATRNGDQMEVITVMADRTSSSWFYPRPTGDPGRDRNARTLQFACFLLVLAVTATTIMDALSPEMREVPLMVFSIAGLLAAAVINHAGRTAWAARTAILALLLTAVLLVFSARDGFRSHAMLMFPCLLLVSVMLLDRASYMITAGIVLFAVALLGIAERHGLTAAMPGMRSATSTASIIYVDLTLMVFALVGSRIARDAERNISDLRSIINQSSSSNAALTEAADAMRQSELKYRRLYESITDGVLAVDMAGHILETNPTFQAMLGYTGEQLRRFTYQELTPERWRAVDARLVAEQVLARGHSEIYEKEYRRRDGTVVPVELRRYLLRDESDQPIGMWAIVRDITGRKHDEQTISEGEQRLRIAKDAAKLGIYQYDVEAGTILWDAMVRQLWGVGPDAPITIDTFFSGLHPEDRVKTQALLERALDPAGCGEYYAEYRVISDADGSERWVAATGRVFFENGKPTHMIGTGQDISERKRAEAALRESEERFRRVFEEGPLGLALVGRDYHFSNVNSALAQMVGYSQEELEQKTFSEITHPDDLQADIDLAERLFKREIPFYRIQKRYVKKTGEIIWINLTASILTGPDGEPLHGLAMVEDITEMKRAQEEAFFSQKLESLGTLASGIAHDFNNLLGAVLAQAELAQAESDADSPCLENLEAIREVAIRGSEIVRQLMIYCGKDSTATGVADVSKIVDEMLTLLKVSVTKHAVITVNLDPDLPSTRASAAQLRQIVMNLVTNASEALGDRDGEIRVTTRHMALTEESAAASSRSLPAKDCVQLEVSDTGHGMSPQTRPRVYDPFFTTKPAGRGLGLAVVQGIVRSLGGTIQFTSEPDMGTTFQISLPCVENLPDASGRTIPIEEDSAVPTRNATVLVVDDESSLRDPVGKLLRNSGFKVLEAADGTSAIKLIHEQGAGIDAILLDMTLPGASTGEIVAQAAKVKPDIRVTLTSAYSRESAEMSAPQIRSFIRKPFTLGDLVKTLRNSLSS